MEQHDLLRHVCELLDRLGVAYMVTGSQATIAYGEPRFTNDIDIVADLSPATLGQFCDGFSEDDFYLSRAAAKDAVDQHGMFNVIHPRSGLKIDVIIPAAVPYDRQRLARAQRVKVAEDYEALFTTAEDIILKKLDWHRQGGGDRHLRDIAGILKVRRARLDFDYLDQHARLLGLEDSWRDIQTRAKQG
jgi:hypothetical protein